MCLVSAQKAIDEGKTPAIQIADRDWNDVSTATRIKMEPPTKVWNIARDWVKHSNPQESFDGQTFCLRTMFTGFMVDASNIMTFESVGNMSSDVKYSIEFWIFKPKENGEQVYNHQVLQWKFNYY